MGGDRTLSEALKQALKLPKRQPGHVRGYEE
jgi:hypothetical protein